MVSFRIASLLSVVAVGALGLMGCVNEGRARPQSASAYDPSSLYTPSPNYRPLAVNPPTNVTGVPNNEGISNANACNEGSPRDIQGAAITSPNQRLCP